MIALGNTMPTGPFVSTAKAMHRYIQYFLSSAYASKDALKKKVNVLSVTAAFPR